MNKNYGKERRKRRIFIRRWKTGDADVTWRDRCQHIICFGLSFMILSYALILPVSQLQTQHLMTSQIGSHLEYLSYSYVHFTPKIDEKYGPNNGF